MPLIEAYGLTETSPARDDQSARPARVQRLDRPADPVDRGHPARRRRQGRAARPAGRDLHPRAAGDGGLLATARTRPRRCIDKDGWFATGDIGVMDERGFVRIVDRKKDMILVSGFNVYPNEIEGVVAMHPGVLECAAVGVPDEKSGEAVKLFVVKKDPALTAEDVLQALPRAPDRLQVPARRRVPHRAAEDQRRQDPAPRAARRGEAQGRISRPAARTDERIASRCPTASRRCASCRCRPTRTSTATSSAAGSCRRSTSPAACSRRGARAAAWRRSPSTRSCSSSRC